jgi:hypothetical protein
MLLSQQHGVRSSADSAFGQGTQIRFCRPSSPTSYHPPTFSPSPPRQVAYATNAKALTHAKVSRPKSTPQQTIFSVAMYADGFVKTAQRPLPTDLDSTSSASDDAGDGFLPTNDLNKVDTVQNFSDLPYLDAVERVEEDDEVNDDEEPLGDIEKEDVSAVISSTPPQLEDIMLASLPVNPIMHRGPMSTHNKTVNTLVKNSALQQQGLTDKLAESFPKDVSIYAKHAEALVNSQTVDYAPLGLQARPLVGKCEK